MNINTNQNNGVATPPNGVATPTNGVATPTNRVAVPPNRVAVPAVPATPPTLQLPIDLRPILNYRLVKSSNFDLNFNESFSLDQINSTFFPDKNNITIPYVEDNLKLALRMSPRGQLDYAILASTTQAPSYVILDGQRLDCIGYLGGGSYGKVARVRAQNGKEYALKRQYSYDPLAYLSQLREGIINFLVHSQGTRCKYTNAIYKMGAAFSEEITLPQQVLTFQKGHVLQKKGVYCYHLTELMSGNACTLFNSLTNPESSTEITNCLIEISTDLNDLWKISYFNHKDLKSDNIFYYEEHGVRSYYIADFGFSSIFLRTSRGDLFTLLTMKRENLVNNLESRDMTQFLWELCYHFTGFLNENLKNKIHELLLQAPPIPAKGTIILVPQVGYQPFQWVNVYDWVNKNYCPERTPKKIMDAFHAELFPVKVPCKPDVESPFSPMAIEVQGGRRKRKYKTTRRVVKKLKKSRRLTRK